MIHEVTQSTTKMNIVQENKISKIILDCAFKVHTRLGPGLLESAYKECLAYELTKAELVYY